MQFAICLCCSCSCSCSWLSLVLIAADCMCFSLFSTPALALHNNFLASAFYQYLLPTICIFIGNTHRTPHTHTAHTSHKSENNKRLLVPSFFFSFFVPHFRYPLAIILFLLASLIPSLASLLLHNFICLACFIVSVACASHFNATESRPAALALGAWTEQQTQPFATSFSEFLICQPKAFSPLASGSGAPWQR